MKNRRLNILLVAIIAVAAVPQALEDARNLVNAAHERAEMEFWSIFLSSRLPQGDNQKSLSRSALLASARKEDGNNCPLERGSSDNEKVANASRTLRNTASPSRALDSSSAKARPASQSEDIDFDADAVEGKDETHPVLFSEREKTALRIASLHSRDAEKSAAAKPSAAAKASLASSFSEEDEEARLRARRAAETDKATRQKIRYTRDRSRLSELPAVRSLRGI